MAEIFTLQSHQILDNWHWIERFLERVERPDWTMGEVYEDLVNARAQLWGAAGGTGEPFIKGIWITRLENTPSKRIGVLWIAAGEPLSEGLRLFHEHTVPWLAEMGCDSIRVEGRKGWGNVLPGFEERARVFVRELR